MEKDFKCRGSSAEKQAPMNNLGVADPLKWDTYRSILEWSLEAMLNRFGLAAGAAAGGGATEGVSLMLAIFYACSRFAGVTGIRPNITLPSEDEAKKPWGGSTCYAILEIPGEPDAHLEMLLEPGTNGATDIRIAVAPNIEPPSKGTKAEGGGDDADIG